jgi:hypothetical protein
VTGVEPGDVLADSSFDKLQDNAEVVVSGTGSGKGAAGASPAAKAGSKQK